MNVELDMPVGTVCVHPEHGAGKVIFNKQSEFGVRLLLVSFSRGGVEWLRPDENFLDISPSHASEIGVA